MKAFNNLASYAEVSVERNSITFLQNIVLFLPKKYVNAFFYCLEA